MLCVVLHIWSLFSLSSPAFHCQFTSSYTWNLKLKVLLSGWETICTQSESEKPIVKGNRRLNFFSKNRTIQVFCRKISFAIAKSVILFIILRIHSPFLFIPRDECVHVYKCRYCKILSIFITFLDYFPCSSYLCSFNWVGTSSLSDKLPQLKCY